MTELSAVEAREIAFLRAGVDDVARAVLHFEEPWAAYEAANGAASALVNDLEWLPHGGSVYVAWAEVTDLFETGKTSLPDAHALLRDAADRWLRWSAAPSSAGLKDWVEDTTGATAALVRRDGDFWREGNGQ